MNDEPKEGDAKTRDCYCGGEIRFVFDRHRTDSRGTKWFHYKKPRWRLVNCFPRNNKDA